MYCAISITSHENKQTVPHFPFLLFDDYLFRFQSANERRRKSNAVTLRTKKRFSFIRNEQQRKIVYSAAVRLLCVNFSFLISNANDIFGIKVWSWRQRQNRTIQNAQLVLASISDSRAMKNWCEVIRFKYKRRIAVAISDFMSFYFDWFIASNQENKIKTLHRNQKAQNFNLRDVHPYSGCNPRDLTAFQQPQQTPRWLHEVVRPSCPRYNWLINWPFLNFRCRLPLRVRIDQADRHNWYLLDRYHLPRSLAEFWTETRE